MNKRNLPSRNQREHLTSDVIGQYLFGKMPDRTRHRVERHLLECDLCSDAMDGFAEQKSPPRTAQNLDDLRARLDKRVNRFRLVLPFGMQPYAVAASIVLLITCTLAVWLTYSHQTKEKTLSQTTQAIQEVRTEANGIISNEPASPPNPVVEDTTLLALAEKPHQKAPGPVVMEKDGLKVKKSAPQPDVVAESTLANNTDSEEPKENSEEIVAANKPDKLPVETEAKEAPLISDKKRVASAPQHSDSPNSRSSEIARQQTIPATAKGVARVVKGKVTNAADGTPLPGVNVMVKGSNASALTDTYGNFTLEVPENGKALVFNFIGMQPEERAVASTDFVRVQMQPDLQALNEMVVIGYGKDKEKSAVPTELAKPEGGLDKFNQYVKENLRHPDSTQRETVVKVECVVQADGTLSNFVIRKSAGEVYDREAIRVLKEGPRWQPARQQGKPVPKKVTLRIPFKP